MLEIQVLFRLCARHDEDYISHDSPPLDAIGETESGHSEPWRTLATGSCESLEHRRMRVHMPLICGRVWSQTRRELP